MQLMVSFFHTLFWWVSWFKSFDDGVDKGSSRIDQIDHMIQNDDDYSLSSLWMNWIFVFHFVVQYFFTELN